MKLARFTHNNATRIGVVVDDLDHRPRRDPRNFRARWSRS